MGTAQFANAVLAQATGCVARIVLPQPIATSTAKCVFTTSANPTACQLAKKIQTADSRGPVALNAFSINASLEAVEASA